MNVIKQIGNLIENTTRNNPEVGRVYDTDGISPTLPNGAGGGHRQPKVIVNTGNMQTDSQRNRWTTRLDLWNQWFNGNDSEFLL